MDSPDQEFDIVLHIVISSGGPIVGELQTLLNIVGNSHDSIDAIGPEYVIHKLLKVVCIVLRALESDPIMELNGGIGKSSWINSSDKDVVVVVNIEDLEAIKASRGLSQPILSLIGLVHLNEPLFVRGDQSQSTLDIQRDILIREGGSKQIRVVPHVLSQVHLWIVDGLLKGSLVEVLYSIKSDSMLELIETLSCAPLTRSVSGDWKIGGLNTHTDRSELQDVGRGWEELVSQTSVGLVSEIFLVDIADDIASIALSAPEQVQQCLNGSWACDLPNSAGSPHVLLQLIYIPKGGVLNKIGHGWIGISYGVHGENELSSAVVVLNVVSDPEIDLLPLELSENSLDAQGSLQNVVL